MEIGHLVAFPTLKISPAVSWYTGWYEENWHNKNLPNLLFKVKVKTPALLMNPTTDDTLCFWETKKAFKIKSLSTHFLDNKRNPL